MVVQSSPTLPQLPGEPAALGLRLMQDPCPWRPSSRRLFRIEEHRAGLVQNALGLPFSRSLNNETHPE